MHIKILTGCSAVLRIMGFVCDGVLGDDYMWDDIELSDQTVYCFMEMNSPFSKSVART